MRLFSRKQKTERVPTLSAEELKRHIDAGEDLILVDVRQPTGFEAFPSTILGSVRLPPADLPDRYRELPRDRTLVLFCT